MLTNIIPPQYALTAKVVWGLVVAVALAGAGAWAARAYYQPQLEASQSALQRLAGAVEEQQRQAAAKLAQLTDERDQIQNKLNAASAAQEKKDADAQKQIAALAADSRGQPMRVRLDACNPGAGGGSGRAQAQGAQLAAPGSADPAQAYGVLPDRNAQSLIGLMEEAEQINAAYSSCRASLLTWSALGPWQ